MHSKDPLLNIIYVDDSKTNHVKFNMVVSEFKTVHVLSTFTEPLLALEYCSVHLPDIAVIDIEMPGHNGFWLAEKLKALGIEFALLTSHNNYAPEAFKSGALHYLMKPLSKPDFAELLQRYKEKKKQQHSGEIKPESSSRIFVNTQKQVVVLQFSDIVGLIYVYFQ